jgi:hypothetical protein
VPHPYPGPRLALFRRIITFFLSAKTHSTF